MREQCMIIIASNTFDIPISHLNIVKEKKKETSMRLNQAIIANPSSQQQQQQQMSLPVPPRVRVVWDIYIYIEIYLYGTGALSL